jgi:hypothetical protein
MLLLTRIWVGGISCLNSKCLRGYPFRLSTAEINLIDSSDDEDIQTAIEASLNENVGVSRTTSDSEE